MSDAVSRLNTALDGRYAIDGELGDGGMATVYLADYLKHERKVALTTWTNPKTLRARVRARLRPFACASRPPVGVDLGLIYPPTENDRPTPLRLGRSGSF